MLFGAYPGTLGLANAKGYMTKESFNEVLKHCIKWTQSSIENLSLLALDNVLSHFFSKTIKLARENGVTVLTFPPHCTHKFQRLGVSFNGPFKTYNDQAVHSHYISNPAQPATIYHIAGFVSTALKRAGNPATIMKCLESTGIVPFNRNIF